MLRLELRAAKRQGVTWEHIYGRSSEHEKYTTLAIYDRIFARLNRRSKIPLFGDILGTETKTKIGSMFDDEKLLKGCLQIGNALYKSLEKYNDGDNSEGSYGLKDI